MKLCQINHAVHGVNGCFKYSSEKRHDFFIFLFMLFVNFIDENSVHSIVSVGLIGFIIINHTTMHYLVYII